MSLIIQPPELRTSSPISCLIYGQPGCGKTTFAISSTAPLLIDLDRGLHRVAEKNHCASVQVENYRQVLDIVQSSEIEPYSTIVLDTYGKLIDMMADYLCEKNPRLMQYDGSLTAKGWGAVKTQSQHLLRLLFARNKNMIFVAHEREDKDGDTGILRPKIAGSAGNDLITDIDLMGYMQMKENRRTVCFSPTEKFYAKNSLDLPEIIEIPNNSGNNAFQKLIEQRVEERRATDNRIRAEYDSLLKKQSKVIEKIKDTDGLNEAYKTLNSYENIWDSSFLWRTDLKQHADKLKAVFDKNTKSFKEAA